MNLLRDDNTRTRATRRAEVSSRPVRVVLPGVAAALFVAATIAVTILAGFTAVVVVTAAAVAALLVALAARHTVGALAAGAGMRVARPYCPGERVRLHVPSMDTMVDAEIVRVGPANTTLMIAGGLVVVPNNRMLRTGPKDA